jgi:hypothetical protein
MDVFIQVLTVIFLVTGSLYFIKGIMGGWTR